MALGSAGALFLCPDAGEGGVIVKAYGKSWGYNVYDCRYCLYRKGKLNELVPEIQKKVDSKEIAFSPAVELSYLTRDEQKQFLDAMDYSQNTPSLSQAQRLKKLSREGKCTKEAMRSIMSEEKKEEQERITLSSDTLRKYFPRSYTPLQMQQTIIKLLEQWQKKQQRRNER